MTIKAVMFDLDGTLLDTNELIIQSWMNAYKILKGTEWNREEIIATFGEPLMYTLANIFPEIDTDRAAEVYRTWQGDHFDDYIQLFPGVVELLEALKSKGYILGVVTSRLRQSSERGLNKFGIMKYFDCLVAADDGTKHKPDPEPLLLALDKVGVEPKEAIMIGDSIFDIGCAKNAQVESIFVAWSVAQPVFNEKTKPGFIVHKTEEIVGIIEQC